MFHKPPDKKLFDFAAFLGIAVSDRSYSGSYVWDGQSLAYSCQDWNQDFPYHTKQASKAKHSQLFAGPIWFSDNFQFAHEIAHWLVADSWRKDLPEYGLPLSPDEFCVANGGLHIHQDRSVCEGSLEPYESELEEHMAYIIGLDILLQQSIEIPTDKYATPAAWLEINEFLHNGKFHPITQDTLNLRGFQVNVDSVAQHWLAWFAANTPLHVLDMGW